MNPSVDIDGVRRGTVHGLDAFCIETTDATAAIAVFGGQVISFVPAGSDTDVLWVSPQLSALPTPIRGGVPLCWPYFAREGQTGDVPSHGYARTATWALIDGRRTDSGGVDLELAPTGLDHLGLGLRMTIHVGTHLESGMHTHNPGSEPATITQAFHNYFQVSDATRIRVEGLSGLAYLDKFDGMRSHEQQGDWSLPRDLPRSDRVYPGAGGRYRLIDPGLRRAITVTARSARSAVVWNPGEASAADMADVGTHWREFVCVEAANVGPDAVRVPAGDTHSMWQRISVSELTTH
ncbi:D-hexose-6-phosphate mutarotase [Gordonia sp. NPDC003950]